jgi:hypothetical protein
MFCQQDSVPETNVESSVLMNDVLVVIKVEKTESQPSVPNVDNEVPIIINDVLLAIKMERPVPNKLMIDKIESISTKHKIVKRTYKKKK